MDFRLHPILPVEDEIRRIAIELIEDADRQLRFEGAKIHDGVHAARKDLKKLRAVLRLVRAPLGSRYLTENRCFRDLGRALSSTRDSEAMIEAFGVLIGEAGSELSPELALRTRAYLVQRREELLADVGAFEDRRAQILDELQRARARAGDWQVPGEGFAVLEKGLRRGFGAARRAGREALRHPGPESFHEWRKRNKIHWYHTRLLADIWATESAAWREELDRLNEILGHYQDVELLLKLADSGIPNYTRSESDHLRQLLRRRQNRLRDEAAHQGAPYMAEKPRAFTHRVRIAWERAFETA